MGGYSHTEWRTCQGCKRQTVVYDSCYILFKYGVRHYAHASCLAMKFGVNGGRARLPEHLRPDYDFAISLLRPDGWEMARASMIDKRNAETTKGAA